jgi:hypothetical protein
VYGNDLPLAIAIAHARVLKKIITFSRLYIDIENPKQAACEVGLITQIIMRGENWDYLSHLVKEC